MDDLELMTAGAWLRATTPQIGEALLRTREEIFRLNALPPSAAAERDAILRRLLGRLDTHYSILSPFYCDFGTQISIGDHFYANFNLTILDEAPVTIGDHVYIGPDTGIYTVSHALRAEHATEGIMRSLPVVIGNNVWIGAGAMILPGGRGGGRRCGGRRSGGYPGCAPQTRWWRAVPPGSSRRSTRPSPGRKRRAHKNLAASPHEPSGGPAGPESPAGPPFSGAFPTPSKSGPGKISPFFWTDRFVFPKGRCPVGKASFPNAPKGSEQTLFFPPGKSVDSPWGICYSGSG